MRKRLDIKIYGHVQDVDFRYYTRQRAQDLRLTGFVRNESDGTVYVEAEGTEDKLEKLLKWCHHGPSWAKVKSVEHKYSNNLKNYKSFEINYD